MPVDLDFSRTANLLIRERGEIAAIKAAQRADAMLDSATMVGVGDAVLSLLKERWPNDLGRNICAVPLKHSG